MTNEEMFIAHIQKNMLLNDTYALNGAWVIWMLQQINEANKKGFTINPKWITASAINPCLNTEPEIFSTGIASVRSDG